ncbi:unnamed protein product, partial [Ectocarpus fasciculatus]
MMPEPQSRGSVQAKGVVQRIVHRSVQHPGPERKIQHPAVPSRPCRSSPSHTIIMNPKFTPDYIPTSDVHHRLKNSH